MKSKTNLIGFLEEENATFLDNRKTEICLFANKGTKTAMPDLSYSRKFRIIPGMTNVGFWSVYESLCYNNLYLTVPDFGTNENSAKKYNDLYEIGQNRGVNFITLDLVDDFSKIDCFLFSDFPRMKNKLVKKTFASGKPMFLILEECEVVYPKNWDLDNHRFFEKIFTWHDGFVDNRKYFKFNVYFLETKKINKDLSKKEKLCTLIASNKTAIHPLELYSKRREAIRWFEKNHPENFDLYGYDWDLRSFPLNKKWWSKLNSNKLKFLRRLLAPKYPSWKGSIKRKKPILEKYKFAICYDNARDIPGYILEKIFDCFLAGTVPVYWGANNVTDHIPVQCFIDKRNFDDYENLYKFMESINDRQYLAYLNSIEDFLNSERAHQFSSEYFASTIIREIEKTVKPER